MSPKKNKKKTKKNKRKIIMHYGDQLSDWIEKDYQKQIEKVLVLS